MTDTPIKPYLIAKDAEGQIRLTVRETRFNSQGYPWTFVTHVEQVFKTTGAARAYAIDEFGAKTGQFTHKSG